MSSTFFTSGTTISSSWLNDVNDHVYGSGGEDTVVTTSYGQTLFSIPSAIVNTDQMTVYIDGIKQVQGTSWVMTGSTQITFSEGLHYGAVVEFSDR